MAAPEAETPHQTFAFVLIPRFNMMALTTTLEPLRIANYFHGRTLYEWRFLSVDGETITASNGMSLKTEPLHHNDRRWDAIFVCGSWNAQRYENDNLLGWLRRMARYGIPLGAMEVGTFILARAKLLSGYRVTTHLHCIRAFTEEFADTIVEERLFVIDRDRMTSAGGTAGIDMMLDEVRQRHGLQLMLQVAEQILHYPIRDSATPQRRTAGGAPKVPHPVLREAIALMENNLEEPIAIPDLADAIGISQRKLERLFRKHMGASIIGFYRVMRLEFARVLLMYTNLTILEVSVACGFSSLSHFAKSFSAQFGKRPRDHREAWPEAEPMPIWPGTNELLVEAAKVAARRGRRGPPVEPGAPAA
ncbi:MAG: GlxA family transcriptional regulator [Alphaproteobacteria bacterium]|nr:GlxA family transcriptional regulator [Alphaproteobacteria bacterium]